MDGHTTTMMTHGMSIFRERLTGRKVGAGKTRGGLKLEEKNSRQLGQNTRQLPGVEPLPPVLVGRDS